MVIECSVAPGEMEFGGGEATQESMGRGINGCEWEEGGVLS